jgi:DNA-binding MarR family transcriptional regulator
MTNENFCIAGRMRMLTRIITNRYNEAFAQEAVTFAQASLLMYIFAQPGVRQATLSKQLQIEKSAASRDVQLLQRNGWLTDNRRQGLFLTDEGSALAKRCHKIWKVLNAEVRDELGTEAVGGLSLLSERIKAMTNNE